MKFKSIGLPDTERFPCSKAALLRAGLPASVEWVSLGHIRKFNFDTRMPKRPPLEGPVVASAAVNRDGAAHLCIYPIRRNGYPESAAAEFSAAVLPRIAAWFEAQAQRPKTAVLGVEELVVEWAGDRHREHALRFL